MDIKHVYYIHLGRVLKDRRKARGLSRRELWERIGETGQPNIIYQYEAGHNRPSVWWLLQWCDAMGIEFPSLLDAVEGFQGDKAMEL